MGAEMNEREALKLALEALDCIYSPLHVREITKVGNAMKALRQAIADAEKQEPHCYMDEYGYVEGEMKPYMEENGGWYPVYTAPPQRKPLTDEEFSNLVVENLGPHALTGGKMSVYDAFLIAVRATEAAHGIKE